MPYCEIIESYTNTNEMCEYGCGQKANFAFIVKSNTKYKSISKAKVHICCSTHYNKCPTKTRKQSVLMSGDGNSMFGKKHKETTIQKMRISRPSITGKNHYRWGKTFKDSEETRRKKSIASAKSTKAYWRKTLTGRAFGMFFRSSFELFFILQHYPNIQTNEGSDPVLINYSGHRHYKPDFIIGNKLIEIKPKFAKDSESVKLKEEAAREWCRANNYEYQFITEDDIEFNFELLETLITSGDVIFNGDCLNRLRNMRPAYENKFKRRT